MLMLATLACSGNFVNPEKYYPEDIRQDRDSEDVPVLAAVLTIGCFNDVLNHLRCCILKRGILSYLLRPLQFLILFLNHC